MRKKHNIDDILLKGQELFRKQGYNNTGIEEILRVCNIPKGSFYNFFDNKENFGVKVLKNYSDKLYKIMEEILTDTALAPLERLIKFYKMITVLNENEGCQNGCLLANITQELGGISQKISIAANENFERWIGLITSCVAEGIEQGQIIDNYDASDLASFIHNNFNGALLRSKAGQNAKPLHLFLKMMFEFISIK